MALRFLEARLPRDVHEEVHAIAESHDLIDQWHVPADKQEIHRFLLESNNVEALVDALRSRFGDEIRIVVMPVEATLPRKDVDAAPDVVNPETEPAVSKTKNPSRVSREELYEDIGERITLTPVFMTMAGASALVACLGLLRGDAVAVIGAMVIAPLLGPNVGLALATTLGDLDLGRKALRSGLSGIGLSFLIALGMGYVFGVDLNEPEIMNRIEPDLGSVALALASGVAGGLAFTSGLPASLIGVMVAVALLPPLATGGMLIGAGEASRSIGAFLLLGVNLIAVNLAAVATFALQGIRPTFHAEQQAARRAAHRAIALWSMLLAALVAGIVLIERRGVLL